MTQRLIIGMLFVTLLVGCSGKASTSGSGGATAGTGGAAQGTGGSASGTGGAAGGSAGRGGGSTGGAAGASSSTGSVLERNNRPSRDGHFLQPSLTKAAAATMARDTAFTGTFTGNMWASPLYLENGPGGRGIFFAVTTGNNVIALDETTGAVVWMRNIGASPTANGVNCGDIHPLGILSTPVIDPTSRTIYVAGAIGTTSIARHEVHALSVDDGTEKAGWPVDVSTLSAPTNAGMLTFAPPAQNQRSALSLVNGVVYVAYGGHVGDCGAYHGWVVGINAANPAMRGAWASGDQGEAIWAAGGMASDGNGVFAVTGNRTGPNSGSSTHADSEEVVRITGLGTLTRTNANIFYPSNWRNMDSTDADFGAINPLVISVPGATPSSYVVAIAKDGHMYLLNPANLGGLGGAVVDFVVASTGNSMAIRTVPTAYTTSQGVHVAFSTSAGAMCPTGMPSGQVVMSVLIPAGAPPVPRVLWCAALSGTNTAPIATTTNGTGDAVVWYMSNNRLVGVDGDTGAVVVTSTDTCTGVRKWTSPIAVNGRIVVGGDNHLCSWSPR